MNNEDLILNLIISLIITVVAYCTVPIILRLKNGKYEYEKGRKIVLTNCIIVCVFFVCLRLSQGAEQVVSPAVFLYYYINKAILLKPKEESKEDLKDEVKEESIETVERDEMDELLYKLAQEDKKEMPKEMEENIKKTIMELEEKDIKKEKVKSNHDKKTIILYSVIGVLGALLIGISIYAFTLPSNYESEIKELKSQISTKNKKINTLENEKAGLNASMILYETYEEKADFLDDRIVFVIDGYGNYYYTYDQMNTVTQGVDDYTFWAYNVEQAIYKGYRAWK